QRKLPIQFSRSISLQQAYLRLFGRTDFATISAGSTFRYFETAPNGRIECQATSGELRVCLACIFWACLGCISGNQRFCSASAKTPSISRRRSPLSPAEISGSVRRWLEPTQEQLSPGHRVMQELPGLAQPQSVVFT